MTGVCKRFGETIALADVNLSVQSGEVIALIGENGAGKSTLMRILAGALRPDTGHMQLDGRPFTPDNPLAARGAGVAMIYQELNLALDLTVEQNIILGIERHTAGLIRTTAARRRIAETFTRLRRPDIHPETQVRRLSPAERQLVEIARALQTDARVLVMDEPTSSLGLADIEQLFDVIARLREEGVAVVYISHFLEEVQRVAQRYVVLRDGRNVASGAMSDATLPELVEAMIGRRLDEMFPRVPHEIGEPLLVIEGLGGRAAPVDASLTLHHGEILGLAGLVGAGRTELLRTVFGLEPVRRGRVRVAARNGGHSMAVLWPHTPATCLDRGVGLLSEDRQNEGLAVGRSIADNVTLSRLSPFSRLGWLNLRTMHQTTTEWIRRLEVRCHSSGQPVRDLSGGNQQKVALARLLHHDVDVLLLDEPTRGIDVSSKAQIYRLIGELAAQGKAVLVVSSYIPELLGICDTIAVMHRGRVAGAKPATDWTEHGIMTVAASGKESIA